MQRKKYAFYFSRDVVETFLGSVWRATDIIEKSTRIEKQDLVLKLTYVFMTDQYRWNKVKHFLKKLNDPDLATAIMQSPRAERWHYLKYVQTVTDDDEIDGKINGC